MKNSRSTFVAVDYIIGRWCMLVTFVFVFPVIFYFFRGHSKFILIFGFIAGTLFHIIYEHYREVRIRLLMIMDVGHDDFNDEKRLKSIEISLIIFHAISHFHFALLAACATINAFYWMK